VLNKVTYSSSNVLTDKKPLQTYILSLVLVRRLHLFERDM
jgi:hypothetical protein